MVTDGYSRLYDIIPAGMELIIKVHCCTVELVLREMAEIDRGCISTSMSLNRYTDQDSSEGLLRAVDRLLLSYSSIVDRQRHMAT